MNMKLDSKTIAALELGNRADVIHFDSTLPGFGYRLRRAAGGKILKSWIVQYRHAGTSRRHRLGSAEVLSAERARAEAKKLLAQIELGEDPAADRSDRRDKDRLNFANVVTQYLDFKKITRRSETRRYLTTGYFKPFHNTPIDKITRKDVASRLVSITNASGAPTAARARKVLSALFTWAMQSGLVDENPVIGTPNPKMASRDRVLSDEELAAIWRASGDDDYGRIIRLLILTGCRRGEIGGMRWEEFDIDAETWTLPKERSKNDRALTLPLPSPAWQIVKSVPEMVGRECLFGVHGFSNWSTNKQALDTRCGVTDWHVHDIRRSVATKMADIGVAPHIIETILNHASGHKGGIAGIYNKSVYERAVKAAMALWADHVRVLADGGERKVLPFTGNS